MSDQLAGRPAVPDMRLLPGWVGRVQAWAGTSRTTMRLVLAFSAATIAINAATTIAVIGLSTAGQTVAIFARYDKAATESHARWEGREKEMRDGFRAINGKLEDLRRDRRP